MIEPDQERDGQIPDSLWCIVWAIVLVGVVIYFGHSGA